MAKCDNCGSKEEKTFEVEGVSGEFCSMCQQEIEVDLMESQVNGLMLDWDEY